MAAETFRGCFKRHTRLRRLFSDGENVSQVCGDFFRMAQKACMPAGTFFGWRKRHACLQELFSDGAKGMHACGNIFRKVKCCSVFPGAKDSVCYVRLMSSSEGRKSADGTFGQVRCRRLWAYVFSGGGYSPPTSPKTPVAWISGIHRGLRNRTETVEN